MAHIDTLEQAQAWAAVVKKIKTAADEEQELSFSIEEVRILWGGVSSLAGMAAKYMIMRLLGP